MKLGFVTQRAFSSYVRGRRHHRGRIVRGLASPAQRRLEREERTLCGCMHSTRTRIRVLSDLVDDGDWRAVLVPSRRDSSENRSKVGSWVRGHRLHAGWIWR